MKCLSLAAYYCLTVASLLSSIVQAQERCVTKHGSQSLKKVPTVTRTKTLSIISRTGLSRVTSTEYTSTVYSPVTYTDTFTRVKTVASSTTTVPISSGFIPAASATGPSSNTKRQRRFQRNTTRRAHRDRRGGHELRFANALSATPYPTKVVCHTSVTNYYSTQTYTDYDASTIATVTAKRPTTTTTNVIESTTTTSTVYTSVATRYQGCELADNKISMFHGHDIHSFSSGKTLGYAIGYSVAFDYYGREMFHHSGDQSALESPEHCCISAFAMSCAGWTLSGTPGSQYPLSYGCYCFGHGASTWSFSTDYHNEANPSVYVGNGPIGMPYFAGSFQSSSYQ